MLVILGLLVGGVLTGQSLVRASELRAITTEYNRYYTANQTFRDKYFSLPGDMSNATAFWGKDNTNCAGNTGTAATPGTCNGTGDSTINDAGGAPSVTAEIFQFWKQLSLAGLIEGTYSGLNGSTGNYNDSTIGTSVPASKVSAVGWSVFNQAYSANGTLPDMTLGNHLWVGLKVATQNTYGRFLKPEEAWNIDTKLDDGRPTTGKVLAMYLTTCTNAANGSDTTATYLLSSSSIACSLIFPKAF